VENLFTVEKVNFSTNSPLRVCSLLAADGHERLEMVTLIIEHYGNKRMQQEIVM
jgi:hypothetical protein